MSKLYFRYSAMGAGKSLDLLKVAYNYKERNKNVLILSSALDNRFGDGFVASRTGFKEPAIMINNQTNIFDTISNHIHNNQIDLNCILVDESQFLTKEQVKQITDVVDSLNIPIICYGLRNDYKGEPFEGSSYLMTLSDTIEEIKTICHCGKKATMNMRILDGKPVYDGEQIIIGGNESFVSVCRKHFKYGEF